MNEQNSTTGVQPIPVTPEQNTVPLNNVEPVQEQVAVTPQVNVPPIVTEPQPIQPVEPVQPVQQPIIQPLQPVTEVAPTIPVTPVQPLGQEVVSPSPVQVAPAPAQPTPVEAQPIAPVVETPVAVPLQDEPVQPVEPQIQAAPVLEPQPMVQPIFTGQGSTIEEAAVQTQANSVNPNELGQPNVVQSTPGVISGQSNTLFTAPDANTLANGQVSDTPVTPQVTDSSNVGFVANGEPLKKKKNPIIGIIIGIVIVAILAVVGYFVVFPFVVKTFFTNPKQIYTVAIQNFTSNITKNVNNVVHDRGIFDISAKMETDIPMLEEYADYTYGVRFGYDPNKKNLEYGYSVKDDSNEYSNYYYLKNGNMYTRYSTHRDLIYLGPVEQTNINEIFTTINALFTQREDIINNEDINYIVNKTSQLLIETLDENKFVKEDASITVNGEALKVIRSKYTLNSEDIKSTILHIYEGLISDDKVLEIIATNAAVPKEELKEALNDSLEELKESEISKDNKIVMGIYTYGNKVEAVGFEIAINDNFNAHYYNKDGNYEFVAVSKTEYDEESDEDESTSTIKIIGTKSGNITNTTISIDDTEIAKLAISAWDDTKKEFDYTILANEDNGIEKDIKGHFLFTNEITDKKSSMKLAFDIELEEGDLGIELNFKNDWSTDVSNVNTNAAVTLEQMDLYNVATSFQTHLMRTPLGILFQTIGGTQDNDINDYYEENITIPNDSTMNNATQNDVVISQ